MNNIPEQIICAANWYKDFPTIEDAFPSGFARPYNCSNGIVFSGWRHHNCMYQMIAITGKMQHEAGEEIQGFLTNKNRFVNREEGAQIWISNGGELHYSTKDLYSEDLY